jgi:hypothetical protein
VTPTPDVPRRSLPGLVRATGIAGRPSNGSAKPFDGRWGESGASRREAAERYEVSASTAVSWVKYFRETGRYAAKPRGGSTSPLEKHADVLLALIEVEPDLTLDEVVCAMRQIRSRCLSAS